MSKPQPPEGEKLQKILARAGLGSRRSVETLITDGLIKINDRVATLGDRAKVTDKIKLRNRLIKATRLQKQPTEVILYHKPEGRVCSRDDEKDRATIFQQLPRLGNGRWISVGRLDINTSGLMLLTNNGELANRLMHPSYEIVREYTVRVFGEVDAASLKKITAGVMLDDGPAHFERVHKITAEDESMNQWYRVTIREGRFREVRRIWEAVGFQVNRLHRVRYGDFALPSNLHKGKTEPLGWKQVNALLKSVGLNEEARPDLREHMAPVRGKKAKHTVNRTKNITRPANRKTVHDLSEFKRSPKRGKR